MLQAGVIAKRNPRVTRIAPSFLACQPEEEGFLLWKASWVGGGDSRWLRGQIVHVRGTWERHSEAEHQNSIKALIRTEMPSGMKVREDRTELDQTPLWLQWAGGLQGPKPTTTAQSTLRPHLDAMS